MSLTREKTDNFFLPDFCSPQAILLLVMVTELFILVLALAGTAAKPFDWNFVALTSLFVQWVVLISAGTLCILRPRLSRMTVSGATLMSLGICLSVTTLCTFGSLWLLNDSLQSTSFWQSLSGTLVRNNLIALIMSAMVFRYFYLQKELSRQQQAELSARIQSLHSRIQPHFLFNSMNTIASLIATRPQVAEQVVEDLADLFRANLNKASVRVSVEEELTLARQYISIESLRFGERLNVEWRIDDIDGEITIPHLFLQPVLENAICHGIQPDPKGGRIIIEATSNERAVTLTVMNTLSEYTGKPTHSEGNQMALQNISDRLRAMYGESARLHTDTFEHNERSWYKTVIHCPIG